MKKAILFIVCLTFILAGCTTTNPSLRDGWLNSQLIESSEHKGKISIDLNMDTSALSLEERALVDLLKKGIIIEQKVANIYSGDTYLKLTPVDDKPLRVLGIWNDKTAASIEVILKSSGDNLKVYMKTSADDFYMELDDINGGLNDNSVQLSLENQKQTMEVVKKHLKDFTQSFDFKIPNLKDHGWGSVETPEGQVKVRNIEVPVNLDLVLNLGAYSVGKIAEYPGFNELVTDIMALAPQDPALEMSQEDSKMMLFFFQASLNSFKGFLEGMNEEKLEETFGLDITFDGKINYALSENGMIVSENTEMSLGLKPNGKTSSDTSAVGLPFMMPSAKENNSSIEKYFANGGQIKLKYEQLNWNVNKEVKLPEVSGKVKAISPYIKNRNNLQEISNNHAIYDAIVNISYPREGSLTIGENFAMLGNRFEELDASPYIKDGHTMVPIRAISKMLYNDPIWNAKDRSVEFSKDDTVIKVWIGQTTAVKTSNGKQEKFQLPKAPEIINGRSFVPVRAITEHLGAKVDYDSILKQVKIDFDSEY